MSNAVGTAFEAVNFIGGEEVPASGETLELVNPSNEQVYGRSPNSRKDEVASATAAAAAALPRWSGMTPGERARRLLTLADRMEDRADELVELEVMSTGKRPDQVRDMELPHNVDTLRFFAGIARHPEGIGAGQYMPGRESWIRREPVGVAAAIVPWNYPLLLAVWKVAPALAAGCTVVLKPADSTPGSALALARLGADLFPEGTLNVVCGDRMTGDLLVRDPIPAVVAFTGSTRGGREVARRAADGLKRVHLELGGNCPAVVFDDADVELTARSLMGAATFNAGQSCAAPARILSTAGVYQELTDALASNAGGLVAAGPTENGDFGPLNNANQYARVGEYLRRAEDGSGQIVVGGQPLERRGYFFPATVIAGPAQGDPIACEEVFGPVVTVQRASSEDELIALANDTPYGLSASVWTTNHARALRASAQLNFGEVWINCHLEQSPELPHGGFGESGYGSDMSRYGLESFTRIKAVHSRTT